jgi:imidazoleglycerol phosphate synthase glutamine amidotransferase subunit HisH
MGWNQIYNLKSPLFDGIAENEYMYLVHSFYAPICAEATITNYEVEYASALQRIILRNPVSPEKAVMWEKKFKFFLNYTF